jgi:hypothetical protein
MSLAIVSCTKKSEESSTTPSTSTPEPTMTDTSSTMQPDTTVH